MNRSILLIYFVLASLVTLSQKQDYKQLIVKSKKNSDTLEARANIKWEIDSSRIGIKMPDLDATRLNGKPFNKKTVKRVTFYNFWYAECAPCLSEKPLLNALAEDYEKQVDFIAVTFEEKKEIKKIIRNYRSKFIQLRMDKESIKELSVTRGYPTNVIVVDGITVFCKIGGPIKGTNTYDLITYETNKLYRSVLDKALAK